MKGILVLDGENWDKLTAISGLYEISMATVHNWRRRGWFGEPIKIGKTHYYMRRTLASNLARQKNASQKEG